MRKYVYIAVGGFSGAVLRFAVRSIHRVNCKGDIPLNTLLVNVSGCFLLAFIMFAAFSLFKPDEDVKLGLSTGLLGAYTTFSTLCKEMVQLLENGTYLAAFRYISLSLLLGFAAAYLGFASARAMEGLSARRGNNRPITEDDTDGEAK